MNHLSALGYWTVPENQPFQPRIQPCRDRPPRFFGLRNLQLLQLPTEQLSTEQVQQGNAPSSRKSSCFRSRSCPCCSTPTEEQTTRRLQTSLLPLSLPTFEVFLVAEAFRAAVAVARAVQTRCCACPNVAAAVGVARVGSHRRDEVPYPGEEIMKKIFEALRFKP